MADIRYRLINCECCGKAFTASRSHARFCSAKCRMKKLREGRAKIGSEKPGEKCNAVTLSYLDSLVSALSLNTPEGWQND